MPLKFRLHLTIIFFLNVIKGVKVARLQFQRLVAPVYRFRTKPLHRFRTEPLNPLIKMRTLIYIYNQSVLPSLWRHCSCLRSGLWRRQLSLAVCQPRYLPPWTSDTGRLPRCLATNPTHGASHRPCGAERVSSFDACQRGQRQPGQLSRRVPRGGRRR